MPGSIQQSYICRLHERVDKNNFKYEFGVYSGGFTPDAFCSCCRCCCSFAAFASAINF